MSAASSTFQLNAVRTDSGFLPPGPKNAYTTPQFMYISVHMINQLYTVLLLFFFSFFFLKYVDFLFDFSLPHTLVNMWTQLLSKN